MNPATSEAGCDGIKAAPFAFLWADDAAELSEPNAGMLELVEAQTRLAEAQLAVLQMRNTIIDSQVTCKDSSSTGYIT